MTGRIRPVGKVFVHLCREMIEQARFNAELLGLYKVEFVKQGSTAAYCYRCQAAR